jgi:hypothetical protein
MSSRVIVHDDSASRRIADQALTTIMSATSACSRKKRVVVRSIADMD